MSSQKKPRQPPSGGCVLKLSFDLFSSPDFPAAAFGRLCVETSYVTTVRTNQMDAAAFGRLCVETPSYQYIADVCEMQPPSGGCVLKLNG